MCQTTNYRSRGRTLRRGAKESEIDEWRYPAQRHLAAGIALLGVHVLTSVDPTAVFRGRRAAATIGAVALSSISLDWHALAFALATPLGVSLLFGVAPTLRSTPVSVSDAQEDRIDPVIESRAE